MSRRYHWSPSNLAQALLNAFRVAPQILNGVQNNAARLDGVKQPMVPTEYQHPSNESAVHHGTDLRE
jgi:hypothetical protein